MKLTLEAVEEELKDAKASFRHYKNMVFNQSPNSLCNADGSMTELIKTEGNIIVLNAVQRQLQSGKTEEQIKEWALNTLMRLIDENGFNSTSLMYNTLIHFNKLGRIETLRRI